MLVVGRFCCVVGQGFEPWKAYADGFTVRSIRPNGRHKAPTDEARC